MSTHDDIWSDPGDFWGGEYGEPVTVIPPAGAERPCTGIVTRSPSAIQADPRQLRSPVTVSLPNSVTAGIGFAEWNNRFVVRIAMPGQPSATLRTVKVLHGHAGADRLTFEVGL
jgi:hypothetical protein